MSENSFSYLIEYFWISIILITFIFNPTYVTSYFMKFSRNHFHHLLFLELIFRWKEFFFFCGRCWIVYTIIPLYYHFIPRMRCIVFRFLCGNEYWVYCLLTRALLIAGIPLTMLLNSAIVSNRTNQIPIYCLKFFSYIRGRIVKHMGWSWKHF